VARLAPGGSSGSPAGLICNISTTLTTMSSDAPANETVLAPLADDVAPAAAGKQTGKKKRGPKKSNVTSGSIPVPPPKTAPATKASPVVSATIPITGWGDGDFTTMHKPVPLKEFEPDATAYFSLVESLYNDLYASSSQQVKFIPFSLFNYYCGQLWWYRVLNVHKQNGFTVSQQSKRFLDSWNGIDDLKIPDRLAQYLSNLGNFEYNGETYRLKVPQLDFSGSVPATGSDRKAIPPLVGLLRQETHGVTPTPDSFWSYTHLPVPASLVATVHNELRLALSDDARLYLPTPRTIDGSTWLPTRSISGWHLDGKFAHHTSWQSTLLNLGWTRFSWPTDFATDYLFSATSIALVSSRLEQVVNLKAHPLSRLAGKQGNFAQIAYLRMNETEAASLERYTNVRMDSLLWHQHQDFHLAARSAIPSSIVSPVFCFGYQMERRADADNIHRCTPWLLFDDDQQIVDPPAEWLVHMNKPLTTLDSDLRVPRYQTFSRRYHVALTAALSKQ
jgi:hypothetical protein